MYSSSVAQQMEQIRQQSISVLDELIGRGKEYELADPPAAFERHRRKLRENTYKVLVVGEAKRGKSTFVNALIGRDILPTDVDVATSQVFNIRPSEREAYRVCYEDGSKREIPVRDLPRYGSQVALDAGVVPCFDRIIRWIEVDIPIRFLPNGVSILDTPGLGALYAGHAQITHRFVPEADAVIFVLESGQPVIEDDLRFIEEILTVTRNIFFVQTKIDQYTKEDWQDIQLRNQEILSQRFEGWLEDTRVWPISSTNLRKAASADEKTQKVYLMVSRYNELEAALQAFLARASGWGRTAEAVAAAIKYQATGRKALAGRLAGLTAESKQQQTKVQQVAMESKRRFDSEWGIQGQRYKELREGLQRAIQVGKQSFANTMQPGSDIELAQKAKIDDVSSLKDANKVAEEMPGEIMTAAMNNWARTCNEVQQRCVALLGPFAEAIEEVDAPVDADISGFTADDEEREKFKRDYFTMLRSAAGGGMMVMGATGIASMVMPVAAMATFTAVMPWVAIPALLALGAGSVRSALTGQVKASQHQLKMQLAEHLQKVRRHFFDVDLSAGSFSRIDEYFMTLDRLVNEHVRELVEKKSSESQEEISRLKAAMQLEGREREARTKQVQEQLAKWDNIGKSLGTVANQIKALQKPAARVTA